MIAMIALMALTVIGCGFLLAITPQLMPSTECFAVTVPPSSQDDPRIQALKRSYLRWTIGVTLVCAAGMSASCALIDLDGPSGSLAFSTITCVATIVPCVFSFALMLACRARVRALKEAEGWTTQVAQSAAVVGDEDVPKPISLAWYLLYIPLCVALAVGGIALYDRFPNMIPMHAGFDGEVTTYAEKSLGTVLFPVILAAFFGLMFLLSHVSIVISKRPVDPAAPATSALAYGTFARAQSIVLLVGGLVLSTVIGVMFYLASMGIVTLLAAGLVTAMAGVAFAGASIWIAVEMGQSGARLASQLRQGDEVSRDDDAHWLLGTIYWNPEDPSVMVPMRFGIGWTMNMARPAAWGFIALLVVLTIGFVLLVDAVAT